MDQATLVSPNVNGGREALAALDAAHIKPAVALLMISSEYEDWRLTLASPALDQKHPLTAYEQVTGILRGPYISRLPPLLILPMRDPFIRELRRLFGKTKEVDGMRLGGQTIGNRFITDAFVYRVQ